MNKPRIPVGKMPQKLQEDMSDMLENITINTEQIADVCYEEGFKKGWEKAMKQRLTNK